MLIPSAQAPGPMPLTVVALGMGTRHGQTTLRGTPGSATAIPMTASTDEKKIADAKSADETTSARNDVGRWDNADLFLRELPISLDTNLTVR